MEAWLRDINLEGDRTIWGIVFVLSLLSLLVVYSTAGWVFLFNHTIKLMLGLFTMYIVHKIKFKYFSKLGQLGYFFSVLLLVLVFCNENYGQKRMISLDDAIKIAQKESPDYQGYHGAPIDPDYHSPLHDMTGMYPDDLYSHMGPRYYGDGSNIARDHRSHGIIMAAKGNPDAEIGERSRFFKYLG